MACVFPDTAGREWLKKGLLCSKQRCPPDPTCRRRSGGARDGRSGTTAADRGRDGPAQAVGHDRGDGEETVLGVGRYGTDEAGFAALQRYVSQFGDRVWAIEGCRGIGRHVAQRLLAAGEEIVDVPPKLSAEVRVYATGQGRKTDATDAHSIALAGTRVAGGGAGGGGAALPGVRGGGPPPRP